VKEYLFKYFGAKITKVLKRALCKQCAAKTFVISPVYYPGFLRRYVKDNPSTTGGPPECMIPMVK
jgi:hypothetical protein